MAYKVEESLENPSELESIQMEDIIFVITKG